jgi:hypothetical protein
VQHVYGERPRETSCCNGDFAPKKTVDKVLRLSPEFTVQECNMSQQSSAPLRIAGRISKLYRVVQYGNAREGPTYVDSDTARVGTWGTERLRAFSTRSIDNSKLRNLMPELPTRNLYLFNVNAAHYCSFIQPDSDLDIIDSTAITRTQLPSCGVFHHHLHPGAILSFTEHYSALLFEQIDLSIPVSTRKRAIYQISSWHRKSKRLSKSLCRHLKVRIHL